MVIVGTIISKEFVTLVDSSALKLIQNDSDITKKSFLYETVVARYKLAMTATYKGKITADTVEIYTGVGNGDCGLRFVVGRDYIVYGSTETYFGQRNNDWQFPNGRNIYWTNICSRTFLKNSIEIADLEKYIRKK